MTTKLELEKLPRDILLIIFGTELEKGSFVRDIYKDHFPGSDSWTIGSEKVWRELSNRILPREDTWNDFVLPLLSSNKYISSTLSQTIRSLGITAGDYGTIVPRISKYYHSDDDERRVKESEESYRSLNLLITSFTREDSQRSMSQLFQENGESLERISIDFLNGWWEASKETFDLKFSDLSLRCLRSFNYRGCPELWCDIDSVIDLLISCPTLEELSIFPLLGSAVTRPSGAHRTLPENGCTGLRYLNIRRMKDCNEHDLSSIVSRSHSTLEDLTVLFDEHLAGSNNQFLHRGILAEDFMRSFSDCKSIRSIRIGDLIPYRGDLLTGEEIWPSPRELDPVDGPLGYILDEFVSNFPRLESLETYGTLFSQGLFNSLRENRIKLRRLTIRFYDEYLVRILESLNLELRNNEDGLSRLEYLEYSNDRKSEDLDLVLREISKFSQENGIRFVYKA